MIKYVTLIVILFAASDVFAANTPTGDVQITSITNWVGTPNSPGERLNIITNEAQPINPAACTFAKPYVLDDASKISRSMVLASFAAKTKVNFLIANEACTSTGHPSIVAITLNN